MSGTEDYKVEPKKRPPSLTVKLLGGAAVLALVGAVGYPFLFPARTTAVETSESEEFQSGSAGSGFARIQPAAPAEPVQTSFDIGSLQQQLDSQRDELQRRNSQLEDEVRRLQSELGRISDAASAESNTMAQQLADAISQAQTQNAEAVAQLEAAFENKLQRRDALVQEAADRQNAILEELRLQNASLAAQLASQGTESAEAELARIQAQEEAAREAERVAELERKRQEHEALMALRVKSPSVVFDQRSTGNPGGAGAGAAAETRRPRTADERNRAFVEDGAQPVTVTAAEVIANPSKTVLQGTLIAATLENAVDSSLPGAVTAMVNSPVYSFDGAEVLIPSGSRVFGQYSSDISLGQGRILVRWSRIVTPEGQSVQVAAYGGDQQGRSGVTGRVNTRFGLRFGGAALVSLIGAGPALAANSVSEDNEVVRDAARDVSNDLSEATDSVISEYVRLPSVITVQPGAQVTIMVDRDLEFL